jgi:hypothetical protein
MQNPVDVPIISDFHLVDVLNEEGNDGSNSHENSGSINTNDTQLLKTMLGISDADSITVSPNPETDIEPILIKEQTNGNTPFNDPIDPVSSEEEATSNEDDGIIEEGYIEAPDQNIRRSKQIQDHRARKLLSYASAMLSHHTAMFGTEDQCFATAALSETQNIPSNIGEPGADPSPFLPEPVNLKRILAEPAPIRDAWLKAFHKEVRGFVKTQEGVVIESPNEKDIIVPVKEVYKCKLDKHGMIEKLKCRILFCGDLYEPQNPLDSCNLHASWLSL